MFCNDNFSQFVFGFSRTSASVKIDEILDTVDSFIKGINGKTFASLQEKVDSFLEVNDPYRQAKDLIKRSFPTKVLATFELLKQVIWS